MISLVFDQMLKGLLASGDNVLKLLVKHLFRVRLIQMLLDHGLLSLALQEGPRYAENDGPEVHERFLQRGVLSGTKLETITLNYASWTRNSLLSRRRYEEKIQ